MKTVLRSKLGCGNGTMFAMLESVPSKMPGMTTPTSASQVALAVQLPTAHSGASDTRYQRECPAGSPKCMGAAFDTLEYAKNLETAGVPSAHAQLQSKLLADLLGKVAVSPSDLQSFERNVSSKIEVWEQRMGASIETLEDRFMDQQVGLNALKKEFTHCKWMLAALLVINSTVFLKLFLS